MPSIITIELDEGFHCWAQLYAVSLNAQNNPGKNAPELQPLQNIQALQGFKIILNIFRMQWCPSRCLRLSQERQVSRLIRTANFIRVRSGIIR